MGELLDERISEYVCIGIRPTERSVEDRTYYTVCPDQEAAKEALEQAISMQSKAPVTGSVSLNGLCVRYENEFWTFTDTGALYGFNGEWVDAEHAAALYAICRPLAEEFGFTDAITLEDIRNITSATMEYHGETVTISDAAALRELEQILTDCRSLGFGGAACWFTAFLTIERSDGGPITISIATDSCSSWMTEGVCYQYSAENEELFSLFSMAAPDA